ncbi:MAG: asparagine synthase-related protein [Flaviflexus sp.]|nr:asparagine synthase-related protein [Flaviflexus sp.]
MKIAVEPTWRRYDLPIGTVYFRSSIPGDTPQPSSADSLDFARAQRGCWGAIIDRGSDVIALTDGPRSYPLFFTDDGVIATHPSLIGSRELNRDAAGEFRHQGFVSGWDTLLTGVSSAPAGSALTFTDGTVRHSYHQAPYTRDNFDGSAEEFMEVFGRLSRQAIDRLLAESGDRQLLVPLSGGADSRFIIALLRDAGAKNVLAYTYGLPGTSEPEISRQVARQAGFDWVGIELDVADMRRRWRRPETASFLADTWNAQGLPHIQDWYALGKLRDMDEVEPGAIVLPGHTVVGKLHDDWAFDQNLSIRQLAGILAKKHANLQGTPSYPLTVAAPRTKLAAFLREVGDLSIARTFIAANLLGRQAKYITNSVHAYEHFGFSFALPLYERPIWEHWLTAPAEIHNSARTQYRAHVHRVFNQDSAHGSVHYEQPPAARLPAGLVTTLKTALSAVGVDDAVKNAYRATVELRHPLGLHAFTGDLSGRQVAGQLFSGTSLMGIYADLFLSGKWLGASAPYRLWS